MIHYYHFNKETGEHRLHFAFSVSENIALEHLASNIAPGWGRFKFHSFAQDSKLIFSIDIDEADDLTKYEVFKSCALSDFRDKFISFNAIKILPTANTKQYLSTIPVQQAVAKEGKLGFKFLLSSREVSIAPMVPPPTIGEIKLQQIYNDRSHQDVFFTFDVGHGDSSGESIEAPCTAEASHKGDENRGMTQVDPDEAIGAHRLILCQWPYFKSILEGGFAESGPGEKRFVIRDVKQSAFQIMLKFMYIGRMPKDISTMAVCTDGVMDEREATLEDLFLVSHRYNVEQLYTQVADKIVSKLDETNCVPFLFRTGYMFDELRKPVMKIAAKTCGSHIATRSIRDSYRDHPDLVDIMGELFEAYLAQQEKEK